MVYVDAPPWELDPEPAFVVVVLDVDFFCLFDHAHELCLEKLTVNRIIDIYVINNALLTQTLLMRALFVLIQICSQALKLL